MTTDLVLDALGATVGDRIADGWTLSAVEPVGHTGAMALILTSPGDPDRSVEIMLTPRPEAEDHFALTDRFAIAYRDRGGGANRAPSVVDHVVERIRRGERKIDASRARAEFLIEMPRTPTLFLLPGHIGHPMDIGSRTVSILARVDDVFVEEGLLEEGRALIRSFHIADGPKRYVEIAKDPARNAGALGRLAEVFASGRHACLFGVGEGIPCFLDPGTDLVGEARRMGFRIQGAGGPSSLSSALMRLGLPVDEFAVLGRLESEGDLERIRSRLRHTTSIPAFVFTEGHSCPTLFSRLVASRRFSRIVLMTELTTEREASIEIDPEDDVDARLREIDPDARIVAYLVPRPRARERIRRRLEARGLVRRFMGRWMGIRD